jgi:hypothetical protein
MRISSNSIFFSRLVPFPTRRGNPDGRDKWKVLVNRADPKSQNRGKLLSPSKNQRVCSVHFADGGPTKENPLPTKWLGYQGFEQKVLSAAMNFCVLPCNKSKRKEKRLFLLSKLAAFR